MKRATVIGPTPSNVVRAIHEIAEYLREGNFEQVIISHTGGASFRLTDIYEEILGKKTVETIKTSAQQRHVADGEKKRRRN